MSARRRAMLTLAAPLAVYALVVVGMGVAQRYLLFPGRSRPAVPVSEPITWLDVQGARVPAVMRPGSPTVAWFHGNGEQLADALWPAPMLVDRGWGVAIVEYPGYGLAEGSPSEAALLATGHALLDTLGAEKPICAAHSLGTGIAVALASEGRCSALWLVAPYTALVDVAAFHYPLLPVSTLLLDRLDSLSRAPKISVPTVIVHSEDDEVVPYSQDQTLAAAIPGARLIPMRGGHNIAVAGLRRMLDEAPAE